ncbi:hypothetical protein BDW60DRAFT_38779 [Aspergillus nidulans var. acristatus]
MHADEMLHQAETLPQSNASTPSNRESLGGTQLPLTWMMNPISPRLHGRSWITGLRTQSRSKPVSVPDSWGIITESAAMLLAVGFVHAPIHARLPIQWSTVPQDAFPWYLLDWRYIPAHPVCDGLGFTNATAKAYALDNSSFSSCLSHLLAMPQT